MVRLSSLVVSVFLIITPIFPQFGSIKIDFDDRLLRSDEKHDLLNLKEDIRQFYQLGMISSLQIKKTINLHGPIWRISWLRTKRPIIFA